MIGSVLLQRLGQQWGWVLFRGIVAVLFGVCAFLMPGLTLATLILVWGAYALADGVLAVIAAIHAREDGGMMWPLLLAGLAGIAAGICTFMWPGITALTLLAVIAVWAIAMGLFQIVAAIRLRNVIAGEWWMVLSGALSVAFGIAMFVRPGAGAIAVIWIIAGFAILFGIFMIALSFRLKGLAKPVA